MALSCSNDASVASVRAGCHQATPRILDNMCCLPFVEGASGWAKMDTRSRYMVTAITWLRQEDHTFCETCAEGCHLKSHGVCRITVGINIPILSVLVPISYKSCSSVIYSINLLNF